MGRLRQNYAAVFILTSRPAAFRQDFSNEDKPNLSFFVKGFNADQKETFVRRWYLSRERLYSSDKANRHTVAMEAEEKAASLLQQLRDRPLAKRIDLVLSLRESQQVLQKLALFMVQENLTRIAVDTLMEKLHLIINALEILGFL